MSTTSPPIRARAGVLGVAAVVAVVAAGCVTPTPTPSSPVVVQVSTGGFHTCAVLSDGSVECWGADFYGQLGDGSPTGSGGTPGGYLPSKVPGISDAVQVATGVYHSCVLHAAGTVSCWGSDRYGQLGDGTIGAPTAGASPQLVPGVGGVTQIAASGSSSCAVLAGGEVWCWGQNWDGQLGDGSPNPPRPRPPDRPTAAPVLGVSNAVEVDVAGQACAVLADGGVACWGSNYHGLLGVGGSTTSDDYVTSAVTVPGITSAVGIDVSYHASCVRLASGAMKCWGHDGSVGDGSTGMDQPLPVDVVGIDDATQHSTGSDATCAVLASRRLKCWGRTTRGILGGTSAGGTTAAPAPVELPFPVNVVQVSVEYGHACAVILDGTVYCWGYDYHGQLGDGTAGSPFEDAVPDCVVGHCPSGDPPVLVGSQIETGASHTCLLEGVGDLSCWGADVMGQLGDGTADALPRPASAPVQDPGQVAQVSAGGAHTCGVRLNGSIACWGQNAFGELGNGLIGDGVDPYAGIPSPVVVTGITNVVQVSAGVATTCAVLLTGEIKCWGYNGFWQLGDGSPNFPYERPDPVNVTGISSALQVSVGGDHTCALITGGTVRCWGWGANGQLGNGDGDPSSVPVPVTGITDAVGIASGFSHSCALIVDGTLRCWGQNQWGQLGDTTTTDASVPVEVVGITDAVQVTAGYKHTCVLESTLQAACWGDDQSGQLGDGTAGPPLLDPTAAVRIPQISQVNADGEHTCALTTDDVATCWGWDAEGQLGDGVVGQPDANPTPSPVRGLVDPCRDPDTGDPVAGLVDLGQVGTETMGGVVNTSGTLMPAAIDCYRFTSAFGGLANLTPTTGTTGQVDMCLFQAGRLLACGTRLDPLLVRQLSFPVGDFDLAVIDLGVDAGGFDYDLQVANT